MTPSISLESISKIHHLDLFNVTTWEEYWASVSKQLTLVYGEVEFTLSKVNKNSGAHSLLYSTCPQLSELHGNYDEGEPESHFADFDVLQKDGSFHLQFNDHNVTANKVHSLTVQSKGKLTSLFLHSQSQAPQVEDEALILQALCQSYMWFSEWKTVYSKLLTSEAKLDAINRIGETIGSLDVDVLLARLMEISLFICSSQVGLIAMVEEGNLESKVEWGVSLQMVQSLKYANGNSILSEVINAQEAVHIQDFDADERYMRDETGLVKSFMCVPLIAKGRAIGAINLIAAEGMGDPFTEAEMETLRTVASLAATAIENARLHHAALEKERMTAQLKVAQTIQEGLYPTEAPTVPGFEVAWAHCSCDETGGDYFDFIYREEQEFDLVIGDVSGHGIGSALLMATGRASLRSIMESSSRSDLSVVIGILNDLLENDMDESHFMTFFLSRMDLKARTLEFVNAGHDQPLIYRKATGEVEELDSTGMPLGLFPDQEYDVQTVDGLHPGDIIMLTTDGVWEAPNDKKERFGKERLIEALKETAESTPEEIAKEIKNRVVQFVGNDSFDDDFTMVVVKKVGS